MKTKEFIEKIDKLGYRIIIQSDRMSVDNGETLLAVVYTTKQYKLEIYDILTIQNAAELFNICIEYAKTPIEERKDEKRYYLIKNIRDLKFYDSLSDRYLTRKKALGLWGLTGGVSDDYFGYKVKFTQKEIDSIKRGHCTDLSEFDQIEVEE